MTKQKKAPLTVRNIHGTFTAASEEHVQWVLEYASRITNQIREFILPAYDGTEWAGNVDHFARYSDRTIAIMACDIAADRVEAGLADNAASHARWLAREAKEREDQRKALTVGLTLALAAPDDERARKAAEVAESIASGLSEVEVAACKREALARVDEVPEEPSVRVYGSGPITPESLTDDQIRGLLARLDASDQGCGESRSSRNALMGACRLALKGRIYRGSVRRICEALNEYAAAGDPVQPIDEPRAASQLDHDRALGRVLDALREELLAHAPRKEPALHVVKRASYRKACSWIAWNDDSGTGPDEEAIDGYVSTKLVADLFGVDSKRVARDVARIRIREGFHGENKGAR